MKSNRAIASAVAALLFGLPGNTRATEPEAETDAARPAEGEMAEEDEAVACEEFCWPSEIPVYVPPSRGSTAIRIGGGTRGGGFRS
ncbi:MAG: hypothetical protein JRH16_08270 [Deltaproteobacteria bacterium]|nr:hypothetical protein [Deltaproteobacteria bacterium]MBW2359953.1 hypothetical protein [Deltaproteobacteria bacterium]